MSSTSKLTYLAISMVVAIFDLPKMAATSGCQLVSRQKSNEHGFNYTWAKYGAFTHFCANSSNIPLTAPTNWVKLQQVLK
jgi:hypothetical protein